VRFADVDGTGTPDLLWGDAGNYRYIDFTGGIRPRLLRVVDNGLGKITTIDYEPSTRDYVRYMENGKTPLYRKLYLYKRQFIGRIIEWKNTGKTLK